jgi:hypothetical protein
MDQQQLSGGAKAGYFFLGFFLFVIGILIAWLVNKDKEPAIRNGAIKLAVIGAIVEFVLGIIFSVLFFVLIFSAAGAAGAFSY